MNGLDKLMTWNELYMQAMVYIIPKKAKSLFLRKRSSAKIVVVCSLYSILVLANPCRLFGPACDTPPGAITYWRVVNIFYIMHICTTYGHNKPRLYVISD